MKFKSRKDQNERKHILEIGKMFFFNFSFLTGHLALHFKDDL
jgi:hypothetical protein